MHLFTVDNAWQLVNDRRETLLHEMPRKRRRRTRGAAKPVPYPPSGPAAA